MVGKESNQKRIFKSVKNEELFLLIIIFFIGLLLRLFRIGTREIAYDDAFSFFLASKNFITIVRGTIADTMPPLYYLLLSLMIKVNQELWFLRLLNVFINLSSIYLLYLLARELFGKAVGYISIFFAVLTPFLIYHSQELRMYDLVLLGQVGYLYSLIKIINSKNKILYLLSSIVFGLIAVYSHNLAFVGIFACNFVFFLNKSKNYFFTLCSIQFALLVLFIPWAIYLPQQISKVQTAFWTSKPGLLEIIQSIITFFGFAPSAFWKISFVLFVFLLNSVLFSIWLIRSKDYKTFCLLSVCLASPVLLIIISYLTRPVFVPRIFIFSMFISFILIGTFIVNNWNRHFGKISFLLILISLLISLPDFYSFQSFPRSSFKKAVDFINQQPIETKIVLHENKLSYFPMLFYDSNLTQYYLADPPGSENDTLSLGSQIAIGYMAINKFDEFFLYEKLFFISFTQTEIEYKNLGLMDPNLSFLRSYYEEKAVTLIGDIKVYYFVKE